MKTTLLLQKISRHLDSINCRFLWSDTNQRSLLGGNSYSQRGWGLGVKSTRHTNLAMLMNKAWRLRNNPTTLWASVLKSTYFLHAHILYSVANFRTSHIWKAFHLGK